MFEDFADKTVQAVKNAEELAQQLDDESVATGHVIYGLCADRSTCLHFIFQDLNVDPDMFSGYIKGLPRSSAARRSSPNISPWRCSRSRPGPATRP